MPMSANKSIGKKHHSTKLAFSNQIHSLMWWSFVLLEGEMRNIVLKETGSILQLAIRQDSVSCMQNKPENLPSIEKKI